MVDSSEGSFGEAGRGDTGALVGHNLGITSFDGWIRRGAGFGAEPSGPNLDSCVERVLGVAQEPVALGTGRVGGVNRLEVVELTVNSDLTCFDEIGGLLVVCAVSRVVIGPA